MECVFDPGGCISQSVQSVIGVFPFGIEGIKAAAWMIVGACLGKWGVGAVLALALALKVSGKTDEAHEHVVGKDADPTPPKPKKKRTIFGR